MTALSLVVIPAEETLPIVSNVLQIPEGANVEILLEERASALLGDSTKLAPLLLPGSDQAGLYVYSIVPLDGQVPLKNVRATRLAMACGAFSTRFCGDALLCRSKGLAAGYQSLAVDEIFGAACISPDARTEIQSALGSNSSADSTVPLWLANAAQQNYHDKVTISRLASIMNPSTSVDDDDDGDESEPFNDEFSDKETIDTDCGKHFIARTSLCLHCRGPSESLCSYCGGAYFCQEPRQCRQTG